MDDKAVEKLCVYSLTKLIKFLKSLHAVVNKMSDRRITICLVVKVGETLCLCLCFGLLHRVLVTDECGTQVE
jgi:hypothetical protein